MRVSTELEQLLNREMDLLAELQSLCEEEEALNMMVKIYEEKMAVQRFELASLTNVNVEWGASPAKVLELYCK